MKILRYNDLVPVRWKNGGGVTREIARHCEGNEIVWRLSIADVAMEGPFSAFPGLQRILTVIEGNGMMLERPSKAVLMANLMEPVAFSGDEAIYGLLPDGPCRDFNVIWNPKLAAASVSITTIKSNVVRSSTDGIIGILCVSGAVDLSTGLALMPFDFAYLDESAETATFDCDSTALLIRISPVSKH